MERIGQSLLPTDRALCDELLASAIQRLGSSQFEQEIAAGRSLSITDAVEETQRVLTAAASAGPTENA